MLGIDNLDFSAIQKSVQITKNKPKAKRATDYFKKAENKITNQKQKVDGRFIRKIYKVEQKYRLKSNSMPKLDQV